MENAIHFTINELAILNAVKNGKSTIEAVVEALPNLRNDVVLLLIGNLEKKGKLKNDSGKLTPTSTSKGIRLGGNLALPVSSFTDKNGQRYAIRGTWHQISDDLDISEIEWFDDTPKELSIHEKVQKKRKEEVERRKTENFVESDGKATDEDIAMCGRWLNIDDLHKIWVISVSAKRAKVEISPRYMTETAEMPYGSCTTSLIIDIEVARNLVNGMPLKESGIMLNKKTFLDKTPNIFPTTMNGDTISYISVKSSNADGYKIVEYDMIFTNGKKKHKELNSYIMPHANYESHIMSKAPAFKEAIELIETYNTEKL